MAQEKAGSIIRGDRKGITQRSQRNLNHSYNLADFATTWRSLRLKKLCDLHKSNK